MNSIIIAKSYHELLHEARLRCLPTLRETHARQRYGRAIEGAITAHEASVRIGKSWQQARRARTSQSVAATLTALYGTSWAVVAGDGWVAGGPDAAVRCAIAGDGAP